MIIKYKNNSKKEFFDSLKKIEFSSKIFVLTLDDFDDKFFFFYSDEIFFSSSCYDSDQEIRNK